MSKASEDELGAMHGAIARGLTEIITDGAVIGKDEDTGKVIRITPPASYFAAAIAFAKNNNITADPTTNTELVGLTEALARRTAAKQKLNRTAFDEAAEQLDRDLGGMMQ
jgi:hypothetical protein